MTSYLKMIVMHLDAQTLSIIFRIFSLVNDFVNVCIYSWNSKFCCK